LTLALAALLGACSGLKPAPPWRLPDPGAGPLGAQVQRSVRVERGGQAIEFLAVLAKQGSTVTLAAFSPLGQRLMRLTWGPRGVNVEMDPTVKGRFDPLQALRDLVFATWPETAVAAGLGAGPWSLRHGAVGDRELWCQGRRRVLAHATGVPGQLALEHEPEGYRIVVTDLPAAGAAGDE
jgi:hypothetical protein